MNNYQLSINNEQLAVSNEQFGLTSVPNKSGFFQSLLPTPYSLLPLLFTLLFASASLFAPLYSQDDLEAKRLNTLKYGTETEIATLIQTLRTESADYLDDDIVKLVETTRNNKIIGGAFAFFAGREKSGLEARAIRAIEEREDEENETVHAAIDYLGKVQAVAAAPILRTLLESGEKRFMNGAFRALGQVSGSDSDEIAEYLIDFYENRDAGDENYHDIITAIGATGSPKAAPFLAGLAGDNDTRPALRIAALEAIAKIGDPAGLDAVITCVSSKDPNIRSVAVTALGPFSGKTVDDAILDAFRDSFYKTRIAAAQASRQRKFADAIPYLKYRAEYDDVPAVKEEAIRALGAIAGDSAPGNADAIKILEDLFTSRRNSDRVRIVAGEMLMQAEPDRFLDAFIKEMDEAKQRNLTALYNGFLKIIGGTKSSGLETITRRLLQDRGVTEKSIALDMAANNNLTALAQDIKTIAADRNEALSNKAKRTLEKLGISEG
jgi:HEAT repeat protein